MTTQLRLVEPPEPTSRPASGTTKRASKGPTKGSEQSRSRRSRATVARTGRPDGRRSAAWGDWRLDAGTRRVGREGVAQARRALEQAALEQELDHQMSQAS